MPLLCRVAENIYWMSRYIERALSVGRLIEVTAHLELDAGGLTEVWSRLLGRGTTLEGLLARNSRSVAASVRFHLAFDAENANSVRECVRKAREAARGIRESISSEMWEQVNTLHLALSRPGLESRAEADLAGFFREVREGAVFFEGLAGATMARDEAYHFHRLGMYLERADNVARAVSLQSELLLSGDQTQDDAVRWLAVLRSCGCAEAFARYYSLRVDPSRVLEFLLLNPTFPQSLRYSLGIAWDAVRAIGPMQGPGSAVSPAFRSLGRLHADVELAAVDEIVSGGLDAFLDDTRRRIAAVSDDITYTYLRYEAPPTRGVAAERAAALMAAQQ
jgi:uncharacterized alpha-E superfamily protein